MTSMCKNASKMKATRNLEESSIQTPRVGKRERSFKLSLPILVSGIDAYGNKFQERTELSSISSQEAIFSLNSGVTIGAKLNLFLDIPKTIILEDHLKLIISGDVVFVKSETNNNKKQLISVRLEKNYKINPIIKKI